MSKTLTKGQLLQAARDAGATVHGRDIDRAVSEGRLEPAPEKSADRYVYRASHVQQLLAFVATIKRRSKVAS